MSVQSSASQVRELLNCSQPPLLDGSQASLLDSSPQMHGTEAQRLQASCFLSSFSDYTQNRSAFSHMLDMP